MDRIDLQVRLHPVDPERLLSGELAEKTEEVCQRVARARRCQSQRNSVNGRSWSNAALDLNGIQRWAPLNEPARQFLLRATRRLGLSARSFHRVIRVARTVADLAGEEGVERTHLAEAITYRALERMPESGQGRAPVSVTRASIH